HRDRHQGCGGAAQRLPDRHPRAVRERRPRRGVHGPGAVRRGSAGAGGRRLRPTCVTTRRALGAPPAVLLAPALVAAVFLVVPLVTLVLATPWSEFFSLL